jgi:hypothetical protein
MYDAKVKAIEANGIETAQATKYVFDNAGHSRKRDADTMRLNATIIFDGVR